MKPKAKKASPPKAKKSKKKPEPVKVSAELFLNAAIIRRPRLENATVSDVNHALTLIAEWLDSLEYRYGIERKFVDRMDERLEQITNRLTDLLEKLPR